MPDDASNMDMQLQQQVMQSTGGGAISNVIGMIANYHAAKENQAVRDIQRMNEAMKAGFQPDPKAYTKAWKNAGVPLISGKDASAVQQHGQDGGQQSPTPPSQQGMQPAGQEDPHAQAFNVKSITDVKQRQQKETELQVDGVIRQAVTNAHLKGANQQQVLEQTQQMLDLKGKALKGDMNALGTMYRMGEIKGVDIPAQVYNGYTDAQKAQYGNLQLGYEAPAAKAQRIASSAQAQVTEGRFTNLEDATKYVTAVESGGPVPKDIADKAVLHPLSDMVKGAESMDVFAHMGYSGDQLVQMANKFSTMGMAALPAGLQSIYQENAKTAQMNAQSGRIEAGAAASRAGTDKESVEGFNRTGASGKQEHVQGTLESTMSEQEVQRSEQRVQMAKVEAVMHNTEDKEFLSGFAQTMISNRAKPGSIPKSVVDDYMDELVKRSGGVVTKEEISHWYKSNETISNYAWPGGQQPTAGSTAPGQP